MRGERRLPERACRGVGICHARGVGRLVKVRVVLEDASECLVRIDGFEAGGLALADADHVPLERRAHVEDDAAPEGVLRAGPTER